MITFRLTYLYLVRIDGSLLVLDWYGVPTQRFNIDVTVVFGLEVTGESPVIKVNVRVATSTVRLVVNAFARTALTSATRDMLRAQRDYSSTERTAFECCSGQVYHREATTVITNVGVSASSVGAVDLGATCICKNAHFVCLCEGIRVI